MILVDNNEGFKLRCGENSELTANECGKIIEKQFFSIRILKHVFTSIDFMKIMFFFF